MAKAKRKGDVTLQIIRFLIQLMFIGLLIAGLYMNLRVVIMVLLPATLLFGNFFCGWMCPYGSVQEIIGKIGNKIFKKRFKMPRAIQKYLQYFRYLLFAIMIIGVIDFILTPLNAYGTFLGLFMQRVGQVIPTITLVIMGSFLFISLFFERAFCNYLCTEAAKYGILSMTRIFSIKRDEGSCINCKKCDKSCPMNIEVSTHDHVRNGQCINCMKCIHDCPVDGTLSFSKVRLPIGRKKSKED